MAQIEFFSTIEDENKLITQISKDNSIKFSVIKNNRLTEWIDSKDLIVPDSESKFEICIWKSDLGKLKWLNNEPKIDSSSHIRLVKSLFTKEHWRKEKEQNDFNKMIDDENSPILYYKRGEIEYDYKMPNLILSPQTSVDRLGSDFKNWFNRISSWIRRNGEMVYNWKMKDSKIRNDDSFANTIYALPDALKILKSDTKRFAISINTRVYDK
ncbi:hypothetical protein ACE01N_19955 [Saccharicrinis sp. FJH2]|uniref:hypothetical protein n=1 Tax=Saccharicrinis sp. FJH65 TaxID=3344659 RepID=UPI0035F41957